MHVYHPNATGCSFDGVSYEPEADGGFDVPIEAIAHLSSHGFTTDPGIEDESAPAKTTGRKALPAKTTAPSTEA